jgi:hypothetical protein
LTENQVFGDMGCQTLIFGPSLERNAPMETFDFNAEAVLFFRQSGKGRSCPLTIRRFERSCEAILFAAEKLSNFTIKGCSIEIGDFRINGNEVYDFYRRSDFPLLRMNKSIA